MRCLIVFALMFSSSLSAEQVLRSPITQANLIELYTSEGCSSCPPADRWLSKLKSHPDLWSELVPVAFHVDYWNHLGWRDRFSRREFSERQRDYAREGGLGVVYTPGLMSNGKEWRNFGWWRQPKTGGGQAVGVLEARLGEGELTAVFSPISGQPPESLVLNVALLGAGMATDVRAGENDGRTLVQDFVVLEYQQVDMQDGKDRFECLAEIPASKVEAARYGLALWVSAKGSQAPIQVTGGWLGQGDSE